MQVSNRECQHSSRWQIPNRNIPFFIVKKSCHWTLIFSLFISLFSYYSDDNWDDDEIDSDSEFINQNEEYSHSEIIHQCNFGANHLINARLSSKRSLLYQPDSSSHDMTCQCLNATNIDDDHRTEDTMKTFPTLLKLISGLLVGDVKYSDIYINGDDNTMSTND